MAFIVEINEKDIFPVVHLKNDKEKTFVEVYAFGALLNAFKVSGSINFIDGFTSPQNAKDNITNGFKSAKLSPYVCRIANGKYIFNDQEYKIGKFFLGEEPLHGLLYDAVFSVLDFGNSEDASFATLHYNYTKQDEGFPFNYACTVNYTLEKNNRLTITTSVENNADTEMPLCDGWHPYFKPGVIIDELTMQLNTNKMLEFNERLVPTGKILSYNKFQQPEIFGETFLDNCFLLSDNNKPACTLRNNKSGLQIVIQPDESYPYLQIFTPAHRNSIAIENLSAAPDAFNNKMGIKILKPNERASFKTTYSASVKL